MKIIKSPNASKKYRAIFDDGKHTDFGAAGYEDYISSGSEVKKNAYIARHKANENWHDAHSAGALSRFVLWNLPTFRASVADYKKRFGL